MRHRTPRRLLALFLVGLATLSASVARPAAAADYLAMEPMHGKKVRLDGMLREWPGGFAKLSQAVSGGKPSGESHGEVLVGYDDVKVYLAANVSDAQIVRTAGAGRGEDRLTLELYVPGAGAPGGVHIISVYPGQPGKLPALVQVDGIAVPGAKAVEAPTDKGLIIEAEIPWTALRRTKRIRVGIRGKLTYYDARSVGTMRSVSSTSQQTGAAMPALTMEGETGLVQALLEPKNLPLKPARDAFGDVCGDDGIERVALYGHFLSIVGGAYKGGKEFYYSELDIGSADRIRRLELRDLSGDGKAEIILQKRLGPSDAYREVLQVLQVDPSGVPQQIFAHEVSLLARTGYVENQVTVRGNGATATIEIEQGKSGGFEPGSFQEPTIGGGISSALLPWETVKSRTFQWKGNGLAQAKETSWRPRQKGSPRSPANPASPSASSPTTASAPPPPARAPTAEEMLDRVYALYRKDRGVGQHRPRFDLATDVVEDSQAERVLVHDRDLVVFGKGFKQGQTYTYLTIGVKDAKDILSVTTRDLVGDGKAEIIVHAVMNAQASKALGGDLVQRQALFVYKVVGDALTRIFAAETGRALNGNRVLGSVAFIPEAVGASIELHPLRAQGWTEQSYPFAEDSEPTGGIEPLLLPWGKATSRRYVYSAGAYVRR